MKIILQYKLLFIAQISFFSAFFMFPQVYFNKKNYMKVKQSTNGTIQDQNNALAPKNDLHPNNALAAPNYGIITTK